jgi:hypothetical protein
MVKLVGSHAHRKEATEALRRFGPLALAELRVDDSGLYAGAVRALVAGAQVATVPTGMADEFRTVIQQLADTGSPATAHVELEVEQYVDVWGLCKPEPRHADEPLFPSQYREDLQLLPGMADELDASLGSRAKEKKVRRTCRVHPATDGLWSVTDSGWVIGTLPRKPYRRLAEAQAAGFPLDVTVTIHRAPDRPLRVHASVPPDF